MGGRGASSAARGSKAGNSYSSQEQALFDSIRDKKRENLIIYDDSGKIIHKEGGTKGHTGYSSEEYAKEGMHAVHNHPRGYAPYPSETDLQTFYNGKYKSMTVVSPDYTVTVKQDDKYRRKASGYLDIAYEMRNVPIKYALKSWSEESKSGMSATEFNTKRRENAFQSLLEGGSRAGYKVIITPKGGKPLINKPFD